MVTDLIRDAKSSYYNDRVRQAKTQSEMWASLRHLLPSRKRDSFIPPDLTAENFVKYFGAVGQTLSSNFSKEKSISTTNLPTSNHKFKINLVDIHYTRDQLSQLPNKTSLDIINMDSKLLSTAAEILAPSLTRIYNLSIVTGDVPVDWELARITPIFKDKGSRFEEENYRPISVLPFISRILDKHVQLALLQHLMTHRLITKEQSAFIKKHSTQTALHCMTDDWYNNTNSGYFTAAAFLDLQKCFDTIDHDILLTKIQYYGVVESSLSWFSSYLTDRSQAVYCNGNMSGKQPVSIGIPQGSSLGPILFLLYINDFPKCLIETKCHLFADDTTIYARGNTKDAAKQGLQNDLNRASKWFTENRLTLNIPKSCSMLFGQNNKNDNSCLDISVNGEILEQKSSLKLLGIIVDNNLKWCSHVHYLVSKISPKIGLLSRLRHVLANDLLNTVYLTTIKPLFDYCDTVWGHCCSSYKLILQRLQNRAARIVSGNFDFKTSVSGLIQKLGWKNLAENCHYHSSLLMFKCMNDLAPEYLSTRFTRVHATHSHGTRHSLNGHLRIPRPKTEKYKQSLSFKGPHVWNNLPPKLKNSESIHAFKRSYREIIHPGDRAV